VASVANRVKTTVRAGGVQAGGADTRDVPGWCAAQGKAWSTDIYIAS
jgi:hypothetical protein